MSEYHIETLRWYDHWLKGMDSGVMEGPPIKIWVQGDNAWRSENEWPLARTEWRELYLGGSGTGPEGTLDWSAGRSGERGYDYDPTSNDWLWGRPRLTYRTAPLDKELEITGPLQLDLWITSTAKDTDFLAVLYDEAPDGSLNDVTKGWLRASHRAVDPKLSYQNQPWHPHTKIEELTPGEATLLPIEIIPTCYVLKPKHRMRLEIASCDSMAEHNLRLHRTLLNPARNVVLEGGSHPSKLCVPVIPR